MNNNLKLSTVILTTVAAAGLFACHTSQQAAVDTAADLAFCHDRVSLSLADLVSDDTTDYSMIPRNIAPGDSLWTLRPAAAEEWCSGFWPGMLWLDYEATGDTAVARQARRYTEALEPILERPVFDHDLGFLMFCSYGNGYRLTRDPHYRDVILRTADSLATLYNPAVGTMLSWPRNVGMFGGHNTIMDNMINLETLFWAAENGGSPTLRDIAIRHAEVTMEHHFRPDGTCYHVAVYDPESGEFLRGCTHQGYADSSTWSRGQAWAVYGYTMVYRFTHEQRFLDFAMKVTDAYLSRLPEDHIPYWDFDDPRIPDAPRDASAACVVASALTELSGYVDPATSQRYKEELTSTLRSLASNAYRPSGRCRSALLHSTGHHPAGSEIDYSIVYADYYYMEALNKFAKMKELNNFAER